MDLLPTVLDLVIDSGPSSYQGPGVSLLEQAEDRNAEYRDVVSFSEADGRCVLRRALVTERFKYIYTPSDERQALLQSDDSFFNRRCRKKCRDVPIEELYDLRADPGETQNLLAGRSSNEQPAFLRRLRQEMAVHLNLPRHYEERVVTGPESLLPEEEEKELLDSLRSLGYIQ